MAWSSQSNVEVEGLAELQSLLASLDDTISRRLLRTALRKAAQLFAAAMKARIHRQFGKQTHQSGKPRPHVADDVKVRMKVENGRLTARIGAGRQTAYILNFLEYGTQQHEIHAAKGSALFIPGTGLVKSVMHPGAREYKVLEPAFNEQQSAVIETFRNELAAGIEKQFRKMA